MHWTNRSLDDFTFAVGCSFIRQVEKAMDARGISQAQLAAMLGVTQSSVSQTLGDPNNLTIKKLAHYARALNLKIAVLLYDDGDGDNQDGPIDGEIFVRAWESVGRPRDFFALTEVGGGDNACN